MYTFNEKQLRVLCRKWQRVLKLQDWDVHIRIARQRDFVNEGNQGECEWLLTKKTAVIRILDPVDYDPDSVTPQDHEITLVHELLHLHFAPFSAEKGTLQDVAQEQAIDAIARALVTAS